MVLDKLVNLKSNTIKLDDLKKYLRETDLQIKDELYKNIISNFEKYTQEEQLGFLNLLSFYKIKIYKELKGIFIKQNSHKSKENLDSLVKKVETYESLDELFIFELFKANYDYEINIK